MNPARRNLLLLGGILAVAFLHGLLYVFLLPPWQHYDEPNHFEYVALIARRGSLPAPGDFDPELTRRIFRSRVRHGFWSGQPDAPSVNTVVPDGRVDGYSQLDEPPLYYLLAALPVMALPPERVDLQLYSARLVSLTLFLITVLAGWGATRELVHPDSPLHWMIPLSLALLPGFVDSMTSVNNDVAAVAFFSLFFWGSLRLARRGLSLPVLLLTIAATTACLLSKSTAFLALPLLFVAIALAVLRTFSLKGRWYLVGRWVIAGLAAGGLLLALLVALQWDDAYGWQRSTGQSQPTRVFHPLAIPGEYVFHLDRTAETTPAWMPPLFQPLSPELVRGLRGQPVTLGVWMWADQPVESTLPSVAIDGEYFSQPVHLRDQPAFFTLMVQTPVDAVRAWIVLDPGVSQAGMGNHPATRIYYDGLVLATGNRPADSWPEFTTPDGSQGSWGGQPFTNLLRNGSAETAGLRVRSVLDGWGARILPDHTRPSLLLASLFDAPYNGWFYRLTTTRLFETFWGYFGWGHIPLQPKILYSLLGCWTFLGCAGSVWGLWRRRGRLPWGAIVLALLALVAGWMAAILRAPIYMAVPRLYLPVARYAFPAIIPTMLVLNLGWYEFLLLTRAMSKRGRTISFVVYLLIFASLDGLALISILSFFAGR